MKIVWFDHAVDGSPIGINPDRVTYIQPVQSATRVYFDADNWIAVRALSDEVAAKLTSA